MGCVPSRHSIASSTTAATRNTPERSGQPAASHPSTMHASSDLSSHLPDLPRRNLEASRSALTQIRTELYNKANFKSSNKTNLNKPDDEENQRLQRAADEVDEIRSDANSSRLREAIWEGRGHNCGELAEAAKFLATDEGFPAHVASTSAHGFAVIGHLPSDLQLPDKMENWPDHLAVCDPWANIACSAQDYPQQFIAKMNKWEQAGKIIEDADRDEWIHPTDEKWVEAVLTAPEPSAP